MSDVDDPLRGYRPAGPPPELRERIVRHAPDAVPRFHIRDWLPALAAAGLIALFSALSHQIHVDIDARLSVPDDLRPVEPWLPGQGLP